MSTVEKFDYLVFLGRFQPVHIGHVEVIETALKLAKQVIVVVGSANQPRTIKNPWTAPERINMIRESINSDRISYTSVPDQQYNDQRWVASVQLAVQNVMSNRGWTDKTRVGIVGHHKDESSFYLKLFPQWELVDHEMNETINATDLRALFFEQKHVKYLQSIMPPAAYSFVETFRKTDEFSRLVREHSMIAAYRKAWAAAPYAPTFLTTDAVVVQSGHVLLIERKSAPGEGLLALPGGFVNQSERLVDAMVRELREETRLKVPDPVLRGSIAATEVFDKPDRSLRGRTVTFAYLIQLAPGKLPVVKGDDDARRACWVPISELREDNMFEDHFAIIQRMLGTV